MYILQIHYLLKSTQIIPALIIVLKQSHPLCELQNPRGVYGWLFHGQA